MKRIITRFWFASALLLMPSGCITTTHWSGEADAGDQPAGFHSAPPAVPAPRTALHNPELLLFGGRGHDVFLGCLNCSKFDSESIWNKFGDFGSRFSNKSIWNNFGTYGSDYSDMSPWNRFGQTPPVIVDRGGNFYGYFTVNTFFAKRTTVQAMVQILDNAEVIRENFDDFVDKLN